MEPLQATATPFPTASGGNVQLRNADQLPETRNEQPNATPPLTSYRKKTSLFPALPMPLSRALAGGESTVTGPLQLSPLLLDDHAHRLFPPLPRCAKA